MVNLTTKRKLVLGVVLFALFMGQFMFGWLVGRAQAETPAQYDVATERVVREAKKLQRQQRYTVRRDGQTVRITPMARYTVWHAPEDADAEVTMRWRIRVRTKPQAGTAGWLVCNGRVTVRTAGNGDVNDRTQMRAALATDGCVA